MNDIKPIETIYNGYKFRSRLEARWAVFFDELGIKYEYELEGFELPNGLRYLPDFYLPEFNVYVEVKASIEKISDEDLKKIFSFSFHSIEKLLVIVGTPIKDKMFIFCDISFFKEDIKNYIFNVENFDVPFTRDEYIEFLQNSEVVFSRNILDWKLILIPKKDLYVDEIMNFQIKNAKITALQSRFEFKNKNYGV